MNQKRIQRAFELSLDLMCIAGEDGYFKELNPRWKAVLGFSEKELCRRPYIDFIHPEDVESTKEASAELMRGEAVTSFVNRFRRKDGSYIWLSWNAIHDKEEKCVYAAARDISLRKGIEQELLESEHKMRAIVETAADGIVTVDDASIIRTFNPAAEEIFGYKAEEVLGKHLDMLIPEHFRSSHDNYMKDFVKKGGKRRMGRGREVEGRRSDGSAIDLEIGISAVVIDGKISLVAMIRDITRRKQAEEKLRYLANHDPLTGLINRQFFEERLKDVIMRSKRYNHKFALLFLDLDKFKQINDTLGHEMGDVLLKTVAERLRGHLRESDTIARLGGDEFVIIMEEIRNSAACMVTAQKLVKLISQPVQLKKHEASVDVSIGVAIYPEHGQSAVELIKNADKAMYKAKSHPALHHMLAGE